MLKASPRYNGSGLESLELYREVTHEFGLPYYLHTTGDFMTAVVYVLQCGCNHIHMVVCVHSTRYAQTQKVKTSETVLACHRVTVSKDVSYLAAAYSRLDVKFDCKSLGRELLLRDLIEHLIRIYENRMASHRTLIWNAVLVKFSGKILEAGR